MTRNAFDLTGKVVLVTGANNGLGLGFARGLAKAGADVVIQGRRADRNEAAAADLRQYGRRVMAQQVDVSDETQVRRSFAEAIEAMGRVDGFIANAGINIAAPSFVDMTMADYRQVMAVNLHGAIYGLHEAVRHMRARFDKEGVGGSLIACGSLSVTAGVPRIQPYAGAKGGLLTAIRAIAVEYGPYDIRANMVSPGRIATDLGGPNAISAEERAARGRAIPIPRQGTPEDCAGIVVYLMSDAARYHTGTNCQVDGGLSVALPQ